MFPSEIAICSTSATYSAGKPKLKDGTEGQVLSYKQKLIVLLQGELLQIKLWNVFSQFVKPVNHKSLCSIKFYFLSLFVSCAYFFFFLWESC